MKKYYIVAESGADLSQELIEKHDIRVASMHVEMDGTDYLDGTISLDELCGYYDRTGKIPKTAAVSPFEYKQIFEKIKEENPNAVIIHIGYASKLTSSFQNSLLASEGISQIYHIDSCNVSLGQAYIVMKTVDLIEKNPDISTEKLIDDIEGYASRTQFWFLPGNLKYLRAGGRVSNAKSLIASILNITPLLELIDGQMLATKKFTGSIGKITLKVLKEYFSKFIIDMESIFLGYTYKIENELKEAMEQFVRGIGIKNILWLKAGTVITSHAGPGGIGIAGITE